MASEKDLQQQKAELVLRLDQLRTDLGANRSSVARSLNPLRRLPGGFGRKPLRTFGVACLGTAALTILFRRKSRRKKVRKKSSLRHAVAAVLIATLRPVLNQVVTYMVKQKLSARPKVQSADSLLGP